MRTGWFQRYRDEYARLKSTGKTHEEANKAAIEKLRAELYLSHTLNQ